MQTNTVTPLIFSHTNSQRQSCVLCVLSRFDTSGVFVWGVTSIFPQTACGRRTPLKYFNVELVLLCISITFYCTTCVMRSGCLNNQVISCDDEEKCKFLSSGVTIAPINALKMNEWVSTRLTNLHAEPDESRLDYILDQFFYILWFWWNWFWV